VVPCSFSGELRGDWVNATARFADEEDSKAALQLMNRKYNVLKWARDLYNWILGRRYAIIALTFTSQNSGLKKSLFVTTD
jgi:hypothetical protein